MSTLFNRIEVPKEPSDEILVWRLHNQYLSEFQVFYDYITTPAWTSNCFVAMVF